MDPTAACPPMVVSPPPMKSRWPSNAAGEIESAGGWVSAGKLVVWSTQTGFHPELLTLEALKTRVNPSLFVVLT